MSAAPLAGIRVVDFTRVVAGPFCTQTLADLGADVIKIEHPEGGDDTRGYRPPDLHGLAPFFIALNRGKRSVALDLSDGGGRAKAMALVREADVLVENFSTGVMDRFGLSRTACLEANPRLVYVSTSAYGRTGALAARAGYDPVVQAESGFLSLTGPEGGEPVRTGVPMIDVTTGMTAAQAVLAGLFRRARTGLGGFFEAPLFDTGFAMTAHAAVACLAAGTDPTRHGNESDYAQPTGLYETVDGPILLSVADDKAWARLAAALDIRDPRFGTNAARLANQPDLRRAVGAALAPLSRTEALDRLHAADIPAGALRGFSEAFSSPEAEAGGNLGESVNPTLGHFPSVRSPFRFSRTPLPDNAGPPALGQHTREVLAEWLGPEAAR